MISDEFFEICKDSGIPREKLMLLLDSVKQSYIYCLVGSAAYHKLLATEEKCQWPTFKLNIFCEKSSPIYQTAEDKKLVLKFTKLIQQESKLRKKKMSQSQWNELKNIIEERTKLFPEVFSFNDQDLDSCRKKADRISRHLEKMKKSVKHKRIRNGVSIGAGLAVIAGGFYMLGKIRKGPDKKR